MGCDAPGKPTRIDEAFASSVATGALTAKERLELFESLTDWYYRDGNGMLLSRLTREAYLTAKKNLVCRDQDIKPRNASVMKAKAAKVRDSLRGELSIRQLSILRTLMKADLGIYGDPYFEEPTEDQKAFLAYLKVSLEDPEGHTNH